PSRNSSIGRGSVQANHSASVMELFLAQDKVDDPAAPYMDTGLAAVVQDVRSRAARLFEGVGQDWKAVEGSLVVDGPGHVREGGFLPNQPGRIDSRRAERI